MFMFRLRVASWTSCTSVKQTHLSVNDHIIFFKLIALDAPTVSARTTMRTSTYSLFSMFLVAASLVTKLNSFALLNIRKSSNPTDLTQKMRYLSMMADDISKPDIDRLITQANTWCALNGLLYSAGEMKYTMAPVALVPNTFSKSAFEYAQNMQPILNELVDVISRDKDFLFMNLLSVAESDDFVKRLLGG